MADKSFSRWVELAEDREFIRVRSIERFINDAMQRWHATLHQGPTPEGLDRAEDIANFDFGYWNESTEPRNIASRVLARRSKGVLQVYEAEGAGVLAGDDVLRGSIRLDDFKRLLADEWRMGVVVKGKVVAASAPDSFCSGPEAVDANSEHGEHRDGTQVTPAAAPAVTLAPRVAMGEAAPSPPALSQAAKKEARQDERLAHCEAEGIIFDKSARLPDGITKAAQRLDPPITRQSLAIDVKAALRRRFERARNGER